MWHTKTTYNHRYLPLIKTLVSTYFYNIMVSQEKGFLTDIGKQNRFLFKFTVIVYRPIDVSCHWGLCTLPEKKVNESHVILVGFFHWKHITFQQDFISRFLTKRTQKNIIESYPWSVLSISQLNRHLLVWLIILFFFGWIDPYLQYK